MPITNYGLIIIKYCLLCKCQSRAGYATPCYLTISCRTSNQVKMCLHGGDVFVSILLQKVKSTFCSSAIVYILTKDHIGVQN